MESGRGGPAEGLAGLHRFCERLAQNVERVIIGKREVIDLVTVALLVEGHILFEDVPGTGKTMLARAFATSLGGNFKRIQFTPDLLPNDVTGVSVYNQKTQEFEFRPGPAFSNLLLADEVNRATPRTQSALLESMGEGQVTVDGESRLLPRPFLVMATQNPIEYEGTFPLPEAQLDRFTLRLRLGYADLEDERRILDALRGEHPIESLQQVVQTEELLAHQQRVWQIHVEGSVRDYILAVVRATREHPDVTLGASTRGALALYKTAQAAAALQERDYVIPDDVKRLAVPTLAHRLIVRPEATLRGRTPESILGAILQNTELSLGSAAAPAPAPTPAPAPA
ncbi:MAG TPA: MoxR family ATPase [Chloroflexota bacterium]|nr:MoxR family ATPase [Chloroflexota bacterium]